MDCFYEEEEPQDLFEALLNPQVKANKKTTINADCIEEEISIPSPLYQQNTPGSGLYDNLWNDGQMAKYEPLDEGIPSEVDPEKTVKVKESHELPVEQQEQLQGGSQMSIFSCQLLKTKNIKKQNKKNTNFPKFLVRIFLKHTTHDTFDSPEAAEKFARIQTALTRRKTNNFNIHDLKLMLAQQENNANINLAYREHLSNLLSSKRQEQIINNNYVSRNRKEYLIAAKIYAQRCRSRQLVERAQHR